MHEHKQEPCWDAHCAPHLTHHDPAVRELIARAEARGAERVAQAVEAGARAGRRATLDPGAFVRRDHDAQERLDQWQERALMVAVADVRALLSDERPAPETRPGAHPGETVCEGCVHGPACRVIPCVDCGKSWHLLGMVGKPPFLCHRCEDARDEATP